MDIGIFRRNKRVFVAWVLSPLLLAIIIQLGSIFLCIWANRMLAQNKDMLEAVNLLYYSNSRSEAAILSTKDKCRKIPEATHEVSSWINEIASGSEFLIDTLSVGISEGVQAQGRQAKAIAATHPAPTPESFPSITITMKGRGRYFSVVRFIKEIESYNVMIRVQSADITEEAFGKTDSYKCNLAFRIYTLKS